MYPLFYSRMSRIFGSIVTNTHDFDCDIRHLEHVTVAVHVVAEITGHLEIVLISPQGKTKLRTVC